MSLIAAAQAAPSGRSAPRSIVLTGKAGESPLLYLAPGTFTLIILDAQIVRESVEVEGRARFAVVDVGDHTVTLLPAAPLGPTERLALRVTYREGFPSRVVFLLTGKPGEGDDFVRVSRPQQTVEACRVELEALKARPAVVSPAAVALAGFANKSGLQAKNLRRACLDVRGDLHPMECKGLGASTWSVVVFEVSNTGGEPWTPEWAEVTPAEGGAPRRARAVLSAQAAIPPGGAVRVAVEVEMPARAPEEWLSAPHKLRVCNGDGSRCLSLPLVRL